MIKFALYQASDEIVEVCDGCYHYFKPGESLWWSGEDDDLTLCDGCVEDEEKVTHHEEKE